MKQKIVKFEIEPAKLSDYFIYLICSILVGAIAGFTLIFGFVLAFRMYDPVNFFINDCLNHFFWFGGVIAVITFVKLCMSK